MRLRAAPRPNEECSLMDNRARSIAAAEAWLDERRRSVALLASVDADILAAAIACCGSAENAGLFLTAPARALGERTPVEVALEPNGKARVLELLAALAHGVYL